MSFGAASWLWAVPVAVLLVVLAWAWSRALRRRQAAIGATASPLLRTRARWLVATRRALWLGGLVLLALAAAQPRWGEQEVERVGRGANIALLIDCSRSMLADDLKPDRMEIARRKAMDLMEAAPGHRVALMPFAAVPILRCPLTGDRHVVGDMLDDLSPGLFPEANGLQGTAIGKAVDAAIDVLSDQGDRGRAIVILSDGSDRDEEAVADAAARARSAGIRVYGLFLGESDSEPELVIDGERHVMHARRDTLDRLATRTDAISVNASTDRSDVAAIAEHIEQHVSLLEWEERTRVMAAQRYRYALLPAIALLALGSLVPTRRRREEDA